MKHFTVTNPELVRRSVMLHDSRHNTGISAQLPRFKEHSKGASVAKMVRNRINGIVGKTACLTPKAVY